MNVGFSCMVMDWLVFWINAAAFCSILVFNHFLTVSANAEGDALTALKDNLKDPNKVLQSWNAASVNPCNWYHVTCNEEKSVTRIDLGNSNLSGQLVSQIDQLPNLQVLQLSSNNISGRVPDELGNLTNLVSLNLQLNNFNGSIPDTLKKLQKLRFLRLNDNNLTGTIPYSLTAIMSLQVLDLSNNHLTGPIPDFSRFTRFSFSGNEPPPPPPPTPIFTPSPPASQGGSPSGTEPTLSLANGVWIDKSLSFKPYFSKVVDQVYKAGSEVVDFQNKVTENMYKAACHHSSR